MAVTLLLLLLAEPAEVVETKHYTLDAPKSVAQEYARILEAAYPQFQKYFKAKLKTKSRLGIRVFATNGEMLKAITASGLKGGASLNGQYTVSSQTAHAHIGGTTYAGRVSLLRAAATQFHWMARMRNKTPKARWWQLGIPDFLAQHYWDGTTLQLGAKPIVGTHFPAGALAATKGFDLVRFVEDEGGGLVSRYLSWAFVRFLNVGNQGKPFKGYDKWARKMDGGNTPLELFKKPSVVTRRSRSHSCPGSNRSNRN